jgi:DNA polymerase I-like protein with 3'-5' exonuclease and polymerase domains
LNDLAVGHDSRNRTLLSVFRARSSRNVPSNARFIFGPSTWLRGLIRPPEGCGLAYVDWSSQEIGIAAALSSDPALIAAYRSGDVYLSFARQAGLAPAEATKASHGAVRELCKAAVLGTNYGIGPETLAGRIGKPVAYARELLQLHRRTYPRFWRWSDAVVDMAMLHGRLFTVFGWPLHVSAQPNPRSFMNYPMQANGAEMMRIACCLATEAGLEVCAPVHDALLLAAPLDRLDEDVARLRACMAEASRVVLDGFEIRTDVETVRWPDRYMDGRGAEMWSRVMRLLGEAEGDREAA